jgi:hypothetical protein
MNPSLKVFNFYNIKNKRYVTATEWKNFYGGKKAASKDSKDESDFKRLPFSSCSLTFQPFKRKFLIK